MELPKDYEVVIGLEVHVQLKTKSKIFCSCSTNFGDSPNSHVCPVCLGMPGALPVMNRQVAKLGLMLGLATGSKIRRLSRFARKNYFYPDLSKGYQITQFDEPLCEHGQIRIGLGEDEKTIGITRIHLEDDAGKNVHDPETGRTYVDFNRCGIGLAEIVSEPDMRSSQEAYLYLKEIHSLVTYMGLCDGNMEKGNMRCDANVSLRKRGAKEFGTRTETKNINSFRFVKHALDYEIKRHFEILESGGKIVQETRMFDSDRGVTVPMRTKEEASDYRYLPEPDLMYLEITDELMNEAKAAMIELPGDRKRRFMNDYGILHRECDALVSSKELADYFEAVARASGDPKRSAGIVLTELLGALNKDSLDITQSPIKPEELAKVVKALSKDKITSKMAKKVFLQAYAGKAVDDLLKETGSKVTDQAQITKWVEEVIAENSAEVDRYHAGKQGLIAFFMGQVMRKSRGKAEPGIVNRLLKEKLG